jgi:hypothetical protein
MLCSTLTDSGCVLPHLWGRSIFQGKRTFVILKWMDVNFNIIILFLGSWRLRIRIWNCAKQWKRKRLPTTSVTFRSAQSGRYVDCYRWVSHIRNIRRFLEEKGARLFKELARHCLSIGRGWRSTLVPVLFVEFNGARTTMDFESKKVVDTSNWSNRQYIGWEGKQQWMKGKKEF